MPPAHSHLAAPGSHPRTQADTDTETALRPTIDHVMRRSPDHHPDDSRNHATGAAA
jgi:hypothetical protein